MPRGRARRGQPILQHIFDLTLKHTDKTCQQHLEHMHQFYGLQQGVRIARKHIQAYLQNLAVTQLIPSFMTLESAFEQLTWLRALTEPQILDLQQSASHSPAAVANTAYC